MANKNLFQSIWGNLVTQTNTLNNAGAPAYQFSAKHALAQYAVTGCLNSTYYASAETQFKKIISFCDQVEPEFIARTALYCRERGFMKDIPALLCAVLTVKSQTLFRQIFSRIIDNGKMLRNFAQIIRSGMVGRKSFGSLPKRLIREWLEARDEDTIFRSSIGQNPSLADIIKMVHPHPRSEAREALYGYLIGRCYCAEALPQLVKDFEAFKAGNTVALPDLPFQMLTAVNLSKQEWLIIARNASWQMTRMNLNTFARHGVFEQSGLTDLIANRLKDPKEIARAHVFPYQLMAAFLMAGNDIPELVRNALQEAMEISLANVPKIEGKVFLCPDVSGSMSSPLTGYRKGATSRMRCIDVAALVTAAIMRKNPTAEVLPFEQGVVKLYLNSGDSVITNATRLASIGGGGTNCSAPLASLNQRKAKGDMVIFISDNESWVDASATLGSATMRQWQKFKGRNPNARLVCIDIQPNHTTQAAEGEDILNIGGFSDQVFDVISEFASGRLNANHWVGVIEAVEL
ncbi:MAG: RNA-binding protein [Acidobacteriota bacterium]